MLHVSKEQAHNPIPKIPDSHHLTSSHINNRNKSNRNRKLSRGGHHLSVVYAKLSLSFLVAATAQYDKGTRTDCSLHSISARHTSRESKHRIRLKKTRRMMIFEDQVTWGVQCRYSLSLLPSRTKTIFSGAAVLLATTTICMVAVATMKRKRYCHICHPVHA